MKHRLGLALALALAAGTLWASNMGFLVWRTLHATTPGVSHSGSNTLALPYQRDADLTTANALLTDIGLVNVAWVARFLEPTDGFTVFTGRKGSGPNFPLTAGECYYAKMVTTADYLLAGSSLPGVVLSLEAPTPGVNASGVNFIALPYHSIVTSASALMADIGFANVTNIQRFLTATDGLQVYTGRKGSGPDFALSPTECYYVRMTTTVAYIPSHY